MGAAIQSVECCVDTYNDEEQRENEKRDTLCEQREYEEKGSSSSTESDSDDDSTGIDTEGEYSYTAAATIHENSVYQNGKTHIVALNGPSQDIIPWHKNSKYHK